jgi:dCMP deaminase
MKKAVVSFVPVLHEGYRKFLTRHQKDANIFILGKDLIEKSDYLSKEIRMLDPKIIKKSLESWNLDYGKIEILNEKNIKEISKDYEEIIMPDEDVTKEIKDKYFKEKKVEFDKIFLRWDKHNTIREFPINPDIKISREEFDKQMMLKADEASEKSSDWWRRVGSVIVKNGEIIVSACNRHVPSEHMPFVNGDPRSCFHKGMHLDLSTAFHSEAACIADAARRGVSLEGVSMYVSNFPCPPCAKSIAYSGIKKLYYNIGYGVLDGESILKERGVEIILVDMKLPQKKGPDVVPYEK